MGLLAFCLLPLLAPQAPTPPTTQAELPAAVAAAPTDPLALAALRTAEADDNQADPDALVLLANASDGPIAARAAWLLGRGKQPARLPFLQRVVAESPHAAARLQALHALLQLCEVGSTTTAVQALGDPDRAVRTLAAQLLGALKRPTAREPLLALLQAQQQSEPGPATDVQAALLALHDLDASDLLLRAATSVHHGNAQGCASALVYCLQQMAPKLDRQQQLLLALGMLDHRETLVRRFAITSLAELADRSTIKAVEGRLAAEGPELRPLLEVALAHLRQDSQRDPEQASLPEQLQDLRQHLKAWWQNRTPAEQAAVAGIPGVLFVLLLLALRRRGHSQQQADAHADAEAAAALTHPSDGFDTGTDLDAELAAAPEAAWGNEPATDEEFAATVEAAGEQLVAEGDELAAEAELAAAASDSTGPAAEEDASATTNDYGDADNEELAAEADGDGGTDATANELEVVADGEATDWQDDATAKR